jgi:hypothetical protein
MEIQRTRFGRRTVRLSVASAIALTVLATGGSPAVAECDGPVPSFRKAVATAQRIVIGDVVDVRRGGLLEPQADGRSTRFTLRVRQVLLGEAPRLMDIRDLVTQPCAGTVIARAGDRIAIAFDAVDFTPPIAVNAVAWIRGTPPTEEYEAIKQTEVFELLGLDAPDTALAISVPPASAPTLDPLLLFVPGLVGLVLGWRRVGSRHRVNG